MLLSFVAPAYRATRNIPTARLAAAVTVGLVSVLGSTVAGLVLLSIDSAIILAMLGYEGRARHHPDHVTSGPSVVIE